MSDMSDVLDLVAKYGDARVGKALHNGLEQQASCDAALSAVQDAVAALRSAAIGMFVTVTESDVQVLLRTTRPLSDWISSLDSDHAAILVFDRDPSSGGLGVVRTTLDLRAFRLDPDTVSRMMAQEILRALKATTRLQT